MEERTHTKCKHLEHDFVGKPYCICGYYGNWWRRFFRKPICCTKLKADKCLLYMPAPITKKTQKVRKNTTDLEINKDDYKAHSEPLEVQISRKKNKALDHKFKNYSQNLENSKE